MTTHRIKRLLAAASLSVLGACGGGGSSNAGSDPSGGSPRTSTISGTIVDQAGLAVGGVTVSVFHHNDHTTATAISGADGHYAVTGLSTVDNADYAVYAALSGFGFSSSIGDAAGSVGKFDFNGLYRTVIRFAALPAHDVSSANFVALRAGDRVARLARTGQTAPYATGDDGSAAQGVAWPGVRFVDHSDGTVTDQLTGLVWLKDAACLAPTDWPSALTAANQLASGACGLSDGSRAGQWRMPNVNELESLVDVSQANPALSAGHPFTHVNLSSAYWSSTTYMALTTNAMAIRFSDGRWINGVDPGDGGFGNVKATSVNALWAVRSGAPGTVELLATGVYAGVGGASFGVADDASLRIGVPLTSARFIDNGDGTLADTVTGLTWLKQADCLHAPWAGALDSVNHLASGQCGLSDHSNAGQWRMPNRSEMLSLSDRAPSFPQAAYLDGRYQASNTVTGPVIFDNFIVSDYYWTSTTDAADTAQAWTVYSCDFGAYGINKTDTRYSLAVR